MVPSLMITQPSRSLIPRRSFTSSAVLLPESVVLLVGGGLTMPVHLKLTLSFAGAVPTNVSALVQRS